MTFKSFFEARDAVDAEILAGKLELSGPQNAVLRFLLEHALYKPEDPRDYGFVIESVLGVPAVCKLTGLKQTAVKEAVKALRDTGLIKTFKRPVMAGGRKPDRIRVDWMLPEESSAVSSDEPGNVPSYGTPGVPSYEPGNVPSIYRKEELLQELPQELTGSPSDKTKIKTGPSAQTEDSARAAILALFTGSGHAKRVRHIDARAFDAGEPDSWRADYTVRVWRHESGWACTPGKDGQHPGDGWTYGYTDRSDWEDATPVELG